MVYHPLVKSFLPPIYQKRPIPPSRESTASTLNKVPLALPQIRPTIHRRKGKPLKFSRKLRTVVKSRPTTKVIPPRRKVLEDRKIGDLTNNMINTSQPLSAKQAAKVIRILESHFEGNLPPGYTKVRKKEPLYSKFHLPCSLFLKANKSGRITNVYLSINEPIQEGHDKKAEELFDITGTENKVLLKAKRTLSQNGLKYKNPGFDKAKSNMRSELSIQENLVSKPGIASASPSDKVSWRRSYSDEGQTAYIMDRYLGDMFEHLSVASKKRGSSATQLLMGLKSIHDEGIVHGDLKPENILVAKNGKVGISDFGRSTLQEAGKRKKIQPGTFQYSSPETLLNLAQDPRKSDIFAMGCTLYFLTLEQTVLWAEDAFTAGDKLWGGDDPQAGQYFMYKMTSKIEEFQQIDTRLGIRQIQAEERAALKPLLEKMKNGNRSLGNRREIARIKKKSQNDQKEMRMVRLIQHMVNVTPHYRPDAATALDAVRAINNNRPHPWA